MNSYVLPAILLFFAIPVQSQDSLVHYSEINYTSDFERQAFHQYWKSNDESASLDLFLAITSDGPFKKKIALEKMDDAVRKLEADGISSRKPEKKVKTVYNQVHSTFLIKYELINRFSEIFSSGNYNCVTATALYALIFDRLKIPYAIQEKPTHVFLVAYPNQNNIMVETTSPIFGYLTFDPRYKENFVNNLKNGKLIGASEVSSQTTEELFNKYYFQNENIDLRKLIGLHYLNDGLFKEDKNDLVNAFQQVEKSYLFYPSQRAVYVLTNLAARILSQEKLKPTERAWFIAKASRYTSMGITTEMIKGEFARINNDVLVRDNNRALYNECAEIIIQNGLQDEEIKREIRFIQFTELGRASYNQGSYHQAKYYYAEALEQQPNNAELSATFLSALGMSMRNKRDEASVLDTILTYKKRFPSLENNNNFSSFVANAYLVGLSNKMETNNVKEAEQYLKEFEAMYDKNKDLNVDSYAVGSAYSRLCSYYFKKGLKDKARTLVKKGLEIAPDNYELRTRQQMIN